MKRKSILRLALRWAALAGLPLVLLACQAVPGEEPRDPAPTPPGIARPGETETPLDQPGQPEQGGLVGRVYSASDVTGLPDEPLPGQIVLAMPLEQAGAVLGIQSDQLTAEALRFLKASLPDSRPELTVTASDAAGDYTLTMEKGAVVLCLADSESSPPAFPVVTRGCGLTRVEPGTERQVDISSGFGEVLLVEGSN